MPGIYQSITELIGRTPLLQLNGYVKEEQLPATILAKLEYFNPNQSVKDRIALQIIKDAEKSGVLKPGDTIVETTSGNTGIALAALAATKGYKFRAYLQDEVSKERYQVIKAFGGETVKQSTVPEVKKVLDETDGDFVKAVEVLRDQVLSKEDHVFFANQVANESNPKAHRRTTGPEIWEDTKGRVDILVACVGTGGTISGTGTYLKSKNPDVQIIAVQPGPGSLPSAADPNPEQITGVHPFEGIPDDRIPETFDSKIYDDWLAVETAEAYEAARIAARTDGILVGTSSGAALHAASLIARRPENKGKNIVVILPDTGLRYLSTNLFDAY